ncbi:helix-turn-helix domain-containing protein [Flavitalea sp.]|nr:AraC family transcriptional regulator [Flavitalea sp.]
MNQPTNNSTGFFQTSVANHKILQLHGWPAIQSVTHDAYRKGSLFLSDSSLIFVVEGELKIRYGKMEYQLGKYQLVFLRKDILVEYETGGTSSVGTERSEYIFVSLKYELVKEFTRLAELSVSTKETSAVTISTVDQRLLRYIDSLKYYFNEPKKVEDNLVKIKLLELLFYLAGSNKAVLEQVLDLRERFRSDITATVADNIMNSLSLNQLADLSGRSLSSFRRDFMAIYNMPPSQWIRQKRLEKAQELLQSTTMTITNICYTLGFENIAHFSRIFKSHFKYSPSEYRINVLVA